MMTYIVCDTDTLTEQDVAEALPEAAEVADYADSLGLVGIDVDSDADPLTLMRVGYAVNDLPGGRFPRFSVMGKGE